MRLRFDGEPLKVFKIDPQFYNQIVGYIISHIMTIHCFVVHDLDLLCLDQRFKMTIYKKFLSDYLTKHDRVKITIAVK